jgi:hypothetical protein
VWTWRCCHLDRIEVHDLVGDSDSAGESEAKREQLISALYRAKFVGETFGAPPMPAIYKPSDKGEPTYHLRPHWRRGHWRGLSSERSVDSAVFNGFTYDS